MRTVFNALVALVLLTGPLLAETATDASYWPQWRGPLGNGVSPDGNPPVEWSESENVRWKVEIPGKGHGSPIVWGDRLFVLTAVETGEKVELQAASGGRGWGMPRGIKPSNILRYEILAIRRDNGAVIWRKALQEELPHEGTHTDGSWASGSGVTDGEHVYASFGSKGLYCLDWDGNLKWGKDFGDMTIKLGFGEGVSPVLHGDTLVLNWDHEGQSFIVAVNKQTGEEVWRQDRDEGTSWATPLIVELNGKTQVVTSATHRSRGYELETGDLIWECAGMTMNAIPTPVTSNGIVYLISGFRGSALQAIRLDGSKGELSSTDAVLWEHSGDTPYVPSPLLYENKLYFLKSNNGILSCFNAKTGEAHYGPQRLDGQAGVYASPVGAGGRVYIAGRNGATTVLKLGTEFEVIALNQLDESFSASPAIVGEEMFLRGQKHLYCIARN